MKKIFIDGKEGTTGLKIFERFQNRDDLKLLTLPEELRKDASARKDMINNSDITFLCLPDSASVEAVSLVENENVKIIDASTAHRTNDSWAYGFPELSAEHRQKIAINSRIAVPGCYASGFISIVYPLIKNKVLNPDAPISSFGLSGYSGGGKKMIAEYEAERSNVLLNSPREYALEQNHKHLKEMKAISGLYAEPLFTPIVCDYFSGMQVSVQLYTKYLNGFKLKDVQEVLSNHYKGQKLVKVASVGGKEELNGNFIASNLFSGRNDMQLFVCGNDERIVISSVFDNLGKGASGSAVQCMNISLGLDETLGLI